MTHARRPDPSSQTAGLARPDRGARPARGRGLGLALALLAAGFAGACSSRNGPATPIEPGGHSPQIVVKSDGPTHHVVLTAPSGGWSFSFDEIRPSGDGSSIYLTVRRPDPAMMHTQQLVEQHIDSTVPASRPLTVMLRVLDHGQAGSDADYSPVGGAS